MLETQRLILRKWTEEDAESLFEYAKDPEVGPITGWPPHKNVEESKNVIRNVLNGAECYAICRKENNIAIGSIELILNSHTDMTERDDESRRVVSRLFSTNRIAENRRMLVRTTNPIKV